MGRGEGDKLQKRSPRSACSSTTADDHIWVLREVSMSVTQSTPSLPFSHAACCLLLLLLRQGGYLPYTNCLVDQYSTCCGWAEAGILLSVFQINSTGIMSFLASFPSCFVQEERSVLPTWLNWRSDRRARWTLAPCFSFASIFRPGNKFWLQKPFLLI